MSDYDNKGRFGAWLNKERTEATHPHLSGQGEDLDGRGCWLSMWFSKDLSDEDKKTLADMVKRYQATSKKPFINLTIKSKSAVHSQGVADASQAAQSTPVDDGFGEDTPF